MTALIDTQSGHQIYTPMTLPAYDFIVHGLSNRWLWNCPTSKLRQWFDQHVSGNHLDVGVGTGYFLAHSAKLDSSGRVGLLDANQNCLRAAARRIARLQPEMIEANLAEPFAERIEPFQSLSLMYVLHCLPGDLAFRRQVLKHCTASLLPGGCLFGATILGYPGPTGWLGRSVMASYNRKGIFGNAEDTKSSLEEVLADFLEVISIEQIGSVALFAGIRA
ncbi:methyltransferase [Blastopirellula marina]|uniref:Methyltransferase type 12 n=1 Tax=Blastopirellula marina TaxID=124 RepID=A0A2S8GB77_9BACT|nr:methyltransferase [Blastopirellula marina]PQO41683.1 methyltransferase type 12 [Blastopirellula marina]PTL46126.1 methyltransferase domain-containing protein [Blastopirellula marina]